MAKDYVWPHKTAELRVRTLTELVALYGYTLIIDPDPQGRPDILGDGSQDRIGKAQLCRNKTIAVQVDTPDAVYCVAHELAHGRVGFCDEKDVLAEQSNILSHWLRSLLVEIENANHSTVDEEGPVPQGSAGDLGDSESLQQRLSRDDE